VRISVAPRVAASVATPLLRPQATSSALPVRSRTWAGRIVSAVIEQTFRIGRGTRGRADRHL